MNKKVKIIGLMASMLLSFSLLGQTSLFLDDFNQTAVNPIDSSGQPKAPYSVWTTVSPVSEKGGTVLIEDYAEGDGMIKLLAADDKNTQTGNRTEVSAPLSVYNAPFNPTLNQNTKALEWNFTLKQNRNSAGGSSGFNGSMTGLAVVLAADTSIWGSQQGSAAKGYAVTFLKPTGAMYCASLSKFDGGLSTSEVIIGNQEADVFSEFKTWITVKVTYAPSNNEWNLYFRDENSTTVKGDISDPNGLRLIGSAIDSTFTKIEMTHFGFALNTPNPSVSAHHNAMWVDDFSVNAVEINSNLFTINTTSSGSGSISATPESNTYSFGSEVTLTAIPADGYIFKEWSGDITGYNSSTSVVVNSDMNIEAIFIPEPQELAEKKKPIHYDEVLMEAVKKEIEQNNSYFVAPYTSLLNAANVALSKPANPVTNKTIVPPSGDKHDYVSIGPYWWPDPSKSDGLPWINKDGKVNPDTRGDDVDFERTSEFIDALETLSFAYYFSGENKYAFKAIELLNIWLIDDSTKMNPNANYAQGVPGRNDGSKHGIIEFTGFYSVIVALQIFENKGILPEETKLGASQWLSAYSQWLRTSANGIGARDAGNNHGTWYDFQVLGLMLYEGDTTGAVKLANDFKSKRIAAQIDTQGKQPEELARTKSVNYSTMNLWAMTRVASMSQLVGVDLWNYKTSDGRGIQKAYSFLFPYVLEPTKWTWEQITNGGAENALNTLTRPLFSKASTIFDEDLLSQSENAGENLSDLEKLLFPPREQLLVGEEGKAYLIVHINNILGTVSKTPDNKNYNPGETLALTAKPKTGYLFDGWTGDITSEENPLNIKLDSTMTIEANFVKGLTFKISENTLNGTVDFSPNKDYYKEGDTITCTPNPSSGYSFESWYDAGGISGNAVPLEIIMDRNIVLMANFALLNSVNQISNDKILVYPNPSKGIYNVTIHEPSTYKVFNIGGTIISKGEVSSDFVLDLSAYENSIYILQIKSGGKVSVNTIVKH